MAKKATADKAKKATATTQQGADNQSRVVTDGNSTVVVPPIPENPIANQISTGIVPGITDAPTGPGIKQDSPDAKQPDIQGEINESVVNPVAPPVEPQGVPEAVVREVAVPNAQPEPTFHDGGDYNRAVSALKKALEHGNFDLDFARQLKREAGIL